MRINVVSPDILLAQKIYAIFKRKRAIGRDFYDTAFLSGKAKPNLEYLKSKFNIKDMVTLKQKLLSKCKGLNFKQLAREVEPFLFNPGDSKKVLYFHDYIRGLNLLPIHRKGKNFIHDWPSKFQGKLF